MDSLTAYYLARELAARWHGRRVRSCALDRALRTVTIAAEGSGPVRFDLSAPEVRVYDGAEPPGEGALDGWTVVDVSAPPDDRRLVVRVEKSGKFRGSSVRRAVLEMSFVPAARGAVLADEAGHRLATMGATLPPVSEPRPVLTSEALRHAASRNEPEMLHHGRWMSPLLARWLMHVGPARAADTYEALCHLPDARPSWCGGQLLPFPWCDDAQPAPSLIEGPAPDGGTVAPRPRTRRDRSAERMREELARAAAAPDLRRLADALLALGDVPAPADVPLAGGVRHAVPVRTGETAVQAAERLYRDVRSMERALQTLPGRIAAIERDVSTADAAPRDTGPHAPPAHPPPVRGAPEARAALPYRTYRSSGGLDIWVGRGAVSNDTLTFRHSAPNDVWLHARDSAGAHVVLRWAHEGSPPARDLEEAATLAAWHSKMRSSTLVPVDWTRRKYVRKVRGGAPGLVSVQRARTIFVRPRAEVERALRTER